ncbi:lymphocyte antigen 6 complex locus protein G6d isoform X1 [Lissotriton helveticus]
MKAFVSAAFLLLCSLALGEGLECKQCDYPCLSITTTTCGLLQTCDTRTASKGVIKIKAKGCLDVTKCLSNETNTILGIDYTVTHFCCVGDLCNSGTAVKLSMLAGLAALLPLLKLL